MTAHDNVHVPKESWPNWTWYAIEFAIVLGISMLLSREITDSIEGLDPVNQNWVFYAIVAGVFVGWYILIRGLILKKWIFQNKR